CSEYHSYIIPNTSANIACRRISHIEIIARCASLIRMVNVGFEICISISIGIPGQAKGTTITSGHSVGSVTNIQPPTYSTSVLRKVEVCMEFYFIIQLKSVTFIYHSVGDHTP